MMTNNPVRVTPAREVPAIGNWTTNAEMIADVAKLGYLDGVVLDATYGDGGFWTVWRPEHLETNDLYKPAMARWDYTKIPIEANAVDATVFDPPYKMSGTPALGEFDEAYGIDKPMRYQDRLVNIATGALECFRVCRRYLLVKCQDQVVSGQVYWQTDMLTLAVSQRGGRKVDRFDFVHSSRPQPPGRTQVHARRNSSTLLVFEKKGTQ